MFDIEEEYASVLEDLDTLEVEDFLKVMVGHFTLNPYNDGKLPDRFYAGIINLNENQKNLALVKLCDVLWNRINDDGSNDIGIPA